VDYRAHFDRLRALVNAKLENWFSYRNLPEDEIRRAMRYSLEAGGKRIRPVLALEFCRVVSGDENAALNFAMAIEMVHTYSLIHDDLPCMDDDDLRRGKPTNHKVFGEATAVLAGDGLLTAAFECMAMGTNEPAAIAAAVFELSRAAGESGMIAGQILDLQGEGKELTLSQLYRTHQKKTGCLISAACKLGVIAAGGSESELEAAGKYARDLGLAFQIRDDLLDVIGDEHILGKPIGSDAQSGKTTFVTLCGIDRCRELVDEYSKSAAQTAEKFERGEFLAWLAYELAGRNN